MSDARHTPRDGADDSVLRFESARRRLRVILRGETIADSRDALVLHERRLPPVYYFPRSDVRMELAVPTNTHTTCPFKGDASYWSIVIGDDTVADAMWAYLDPIEPAAPLREHVAFYGDKIDALIEGD